MTAKNFADISTIFVTIFAARGVMAATSTSITKPAIADYARQLSFEPNQGQTDKQVDFLAHGTGYSLFLSRGEAVIVLHRGTPAKPGSQSRPELATSATVRMGTVGGNAAARGEPLGKLAGESNYFVGSVPERWHTRIPNYAKVRYAGVYPDVDMIYYGNQRQLEYDFVVGPGADPGTVLLEIQGAGKADLERDGSLVMHTAAGDLRWHNPIAYQEVNGARKLIACAYTRRSGQRLGFRVAAYDRAKPLIIDPVLEYSTYLGGSNLDSANAITIDTHGNSYVTGATTSTDFPVKNAFQNTNKNALDDSNAFVTKFDTEGNLVYSTYLGGTGQNQNEPFGDGGNGIAVDEHGHAYIAGFTSSFDFPTKNAFQNAKTALYNAFVTKLASAGDALVYSTYLGGSGDFNDCGPHCGDLANGIAVDSQGSAYVTGFTESLDFPTKNAFQKTNKSLLPNTAFVTKFCPKGNALIYSTYLGGSNYESGNGIAVDAHGNAYVTGDTGSVDFPVKYALQSQNNNTTCTHLTSAVCNAFVTKLDAAGNALIYSTYLGGSGNQGGACNNSFCIGDSASGIAVDAKGHAFVTGVTYSTDFPIKNAFQKKLRSKFGNAFVSAFDAAGTALVYSTYLGGSGKPSQDLINGNYGITDIGHGIAVDGQGQAYITGATNSQNFPIKSAFQGVFGGGGDAFITKLCPVGTLVYSSYLGGSSDDSGSGVAVDPERNAYVTGGTSSANFPTKNAFQPMLGGPSALENAFVTKVSAH